MTKQPATHGHARSPYNRRSTDRNGDTTLLPARPETFSIGNDNPPPLVVLCRESSNPDRLLNFAAAARHSIHEALLRCEERYPNDGLHSVLYVVVEQHAPQFRAKLNSLHQQFFPPEQSDPLAPVQLEVVDRATDDALKRLMELGLVSRTVRAIRPLFPLPTETEENPELSDWERQKAVSHRQVAARKLKAAELLGKGGLHEEARTALLEAVLPLGSALAIEARLPEPETIQEAFLAPLAHLWAEALRPLRQLANDSQSPWAPALEQMRNV